MNKILATLPCIFALACFCLSTPAIAAKADNADIGIQQPVQQVWIGNVKSKKFHNSGCKHFACKTCTVRFKSREAAQKAGYAPCGKCGG